MADGTSKKYRYISYISRFAIAGTALYLAVKGEDLSQVAEVLSGLNLWVLVAALAIYAVSQLIFVARWYLLLSVQSIRIGYWTAVKLHLLGLFYNNCLPTSVGGDLLRAWYVTHHTDKKLQAALSVFVDRLVGLIGMLIMAFCCYWFIPTGDPEQRFDFSFDMNLLQRLSDYKWFILTTAVIPLVVLPALAGTVKGRKVLTRVLLRVRRRGAVILNKLSSAIAVYYNKKLEIFWALLLTFACQGVFIMAMWLVGREIGLDVHPMYYFIFFPISWLLGSLPISVGGLGIVEGGLKVAFSQFAGASGQQALVLALCQRLIWLLGSLPGVVIHLLGAHLPKDFSVDYEKPIN